MKKWSAIILLAGAQFIMILDGTVMNVSISTVVKDLSTSVSAMQAAITFFTLTMAALMLTGGKLGDLWGRKRAFLIGLAVYGVGSFITSISPNIHVLMFGWSLVEGLGAVLVIPAIVALVAAEYQGRDRVSAFAIIGATAGAAAAAGPLIGGFVTTYFSWRYVFASESIIVIIILLLWKLIPDEPKDDTGNKLDFPSVILSAGGMVLLVFGILQSKVWGWITPLAKPELFGTAIAPFGVSIVIYLIFIGLMLLIWFMGHQRELIRKGRDPLLDITVLKILQLRSGLGVLMSQNLIIGASFFVMPIYLQMIIGLDALQTGMRIFPLSVSLILFSIIGSRLISSFTPKQIVKFGQWALIIGVAVIATTIDPELKSLPLLTGMFVLGAGLGLLASQLGNINLGSVDKRHSSEVGGMQGTAQNLGQSLGTAIVGSILIMSLTTGFTASITSSNNVPANVKSDISAQSTKGIPVVPLSEVRASLAKENIPTSQANTIINAYTESQLNGLKKGLVFLLLLSIASLFMSRNLPDTKISTISDLKAK